MSGRIEMYETEKEITSKWSKNEQFKIRKAGVDIGEDPEGGGPGPGGTTDYTELINKPKINGVTLVGDKSSEDLHIESGEPLTNTQLTSLIAILG